MPLFCQMFYPLAPTIEIFLKYFLDKNSQDQPLCNLKAPNHCLDPALISSTTKGMTDVLCASVMLFPVAKACTKGRRNWRNPRVALYGMYPWCNRVGWENFYIIWWHCVLGCTAARWQQKQPNKVGSLECLESVYSSSTSFFLACTPTTMHIASYYVHNCYTFFAFQHDLEKCTKSSMSLIV